MMEIRASILVVDDQPELLENLELVLVAEGYHVLTARDGVEALSVMQSHPVDLILADIAMPHMNGYQLYEHVRRNPEWVAVPFLFLTARALDSDIRYGKELGVDDYLTKPIQPEDLLAVVQGKLRRAQQLTQVTPQPAPSLALKRQILELGRLRIDRGQHRAWMDEEPVKLSAREFTLLECLAEIPDQLMSAQELIQVTHELDTDKVEAGALLRPLIRSLRRKLGYPVGDPGCIENVRGVGYRLNPPH
jgi:DNA-binding response OmpR family regulator